MISIAILWLAIMFMGWQGIWFPAMLLSLVLMFLHMLLGISKKGVVDKKFLLYPLLSWLVIWAGSFSLSLYFADLFAGKEPAFTILGFHPSFFWTVLLYWLGGVATLTFGFLFRKDNWLSKEEWNSFKEKIEAIEQEEGGK